MMTLRNYDYALETMIMTLHLIGKFKRKAEFMTLCVCITVPPGPVIYITCTVPELMYNYTVVYDHTRHCRQ